MAARGGIGLKYAQIYSSQKGGNALRKGTNRLFILTGCTLLFFIIASISCSETGEPEHISGETLNSIKDRLQLLEDREEIGQLLMNYGRYLDQRDFESFALLFAEKDGEWVGGMGEAKGQQAIRQLMESTIGTNAADNAPGNFHLFTNERIDVDGDSAAAVTKWIFVIQNADSRPEPFLLGHYEDTLVREEGQWKFLRRVAYSDIPAEDPAAAGAD